MIRDRGKAFRPRSTSFQVSFVIADAIACIVSRIRIDIDGFASRQNLSVESSRTNVEANRSSRIIDSLPAIGLEIRHLSRGIGQRDGRLFDAEPGQCAIRHRESNHCRVFPSRVRELQRSLSQKLFNPALSKWTVRYDCGTITRPPLG